MGLPLEGSEAVGSNLNSLFPGFMRERHLAMMSAMTSVRIFNRQDEFYLNGFDGCLRHVRFSVKLGISASSEVHGVSLLRFSQLNHLHNLLVDKDLSVISAEDGFWNVLEAAGIETRQLTLADLSQSLHMHLTLLKAIGSKSTGNSKEQRLKAALLEGMDSYKQAGVVHSLNKNVLGVELRSVLDMIVHLQEKSFGGESYFALQIQFDLSQNTPAIKEIKTTIQQLRSINDHKLDFKGSSKIFNSNSEDAESAKNGSRVSHDERPESKEAEKGESEVLIFEALVSNLKTLVGFGDADKLADPNSEGRLSVVGTLAKISPQLG